jgi:diguanylate cyclase (GGDEF)-like protein
VKRLKSDGNQFNPPAPARQKSGRRWTIARKLTCGFLSLLVLLGTISTVSLMSLSRLNRLNYRIVHTDMPMVGTCEKMIDLVLAQEHYAQKYRIVASPEALKLFRQKSHDFSAQLEILKATAAQSGIRLLGIDERHAEYSRVLSEGLRRQPPRTSEQEFERRVKIRQEALIRLIRSVATEAESDQRRKTAMTSAIGETAFRSLVFLCGVGILIALTAAWLITRNVSQAVKQLKIAFTMVSKGMYDYKPKVSNNDELGELAHAFTTMAGRLKRLEESNLDTSPLTRLPGGRAIEKILKARLAAKRPVAFCIMDIDNFKGYNDRYGYAKGNELIRTTAAIIKKAVAVHGSGQDFVGHIGGDDFVLITIPERYRHTCQAVINRFDRAIPEFYDPPDRKRGYIIGEDRQGQKTSFPLASISIAVVTNEHRHIENHIEFGELAAELKENAKSMKGSVLVVNRRSGGEEGRHNRKVIDLENHVRVS